MTPPASPPARRTPASPPARRIVVDGDDQTLVDARAREGVHSAAVVSPATDPRPPADGSPAADARPTAGGLTPGLPVRGATAGNGHNPTPALGAIERMQIESVSLAYGDRWVVRDVTLPVRQGEVLALIGASGSGKTTLLRSLNRLTEITAGASRAGRITLDGEEIERIEVNALRRRISMVFQQPNPFPMSIFENVAYALREEHAARRDRKRRGRRGRRELEPAVIDAVRRAGLYDEVADDLDRPALRLSGGQQQRLCIARALAAGPEVLLLDEPCSALDPISTATIERQIVELRESVAIVIVTHNLQQAMRVADHVAFMHLGELIEYGTSEQVFARPTQQRTREYIGGAFG
jgi:phosphate transport system ATP-binding protein